MSEPQAPYGDVPYGKQFNIYVPHEYNSVLFTTKRIMEIGDYLQLISDDPSLDDSRKREIIESSVNLLYYWTERFRSMKIMSEEITPESV